jgi:hypothetical protein
MKRDWPTLFDQIPRSLTIKQLAARFDVSYLTALRAAHKYGYPAVDGRHAAQRHRRKLNPEMVNWNKSNIAIARELLVSRQLVSWVRHHRDVAVSTSTRRRNFHNGKRSNHINHKNTK